MFTQTVATNTLWAWRFGQEKGFTTPAIVRLNLVAPGAPGFQIVRSDTLRDGIQAINEKYIYYQILME